jgi:hypothetical protein
MPLEVFLVTTPKVDFPAFVGACTEVLGYSPAKAADASGRDMTDVERFLSCLATIRNPEARASFAPDLSFLPHVSFSVLVVADERDLFDIVERCVGMSFVTAETTIRRVRAAVVSGTLAQWRDAVIAGSVREIEPSVRFGFNKLYRMFYGAGLNVWSDYRTREMDDNTVLLERKRQ